MKDIPTHARLLQRHAEMRVRILSHKLRAKNMLTQLLLQHLYKTRLRILHLAVLDFALQHHEFTIKCYEAQLFHSIIEQRRQVRSLRQKITYVR